MKTKYTTEECLQAYYDSLEEQLAEKDAMIDWLADNCSEKDCPHSCPSEDAPSLEECRYCWRKAAQEAVKKND